MNSFEFYENKAFKKTKNQENLEYKSRDTCYAGLKKADAVVC